MSQGHSSKSHFTDTNSSRVSGPKPNMRGGGPQHITASNPETPYWYQRIQLNSDAIHLGRAPDSTGYRFSPTRLSPAPHLPLQTPVCSSRMLPVFLTIKLQIGGSSDCLRFNSFARVAHGAEGNTFTGSLKDMIKETTAR